MPRYHPFIYRLYTTWYLGMRGVVAYIVVRASDLQREVAGSSPGRSAPCNNSGYVVHTHVPLFTKQYNWYRRKLEAKQAPHAAH